MKPVVIHKHWIGIVGIYLAGLFLDALIMIGVYYTLSTGNHALAVVLLAVLILTALATFVQSYVYNESTVTIDDVHLTVSNWGTLFSSNDAETAWKQIEDIDIQKGSIFALLFNYGTILIQTAGTERNLRLPNIPDPQHWRDVMAAKAGSSIN